MGTIKDSAIASAKDVLPLPGEPTNKMRFLGSKPYERNRSTLYCSCINCSQIDIISLGKTKSVIFFCGEISFSKLSALAST